MPIHDILISSFTNIAIKHWIDNKNNNPLWNLNPSKNREYITIIYNTHTHTHQKKIYLPEPSSEITGCMDLVLNPQDRAKNIGAN